MSGKAVEDLLDLAEAINLVFWEPGAEEPICRLANGARDYWKTLQGRPESLRYGFVRRLLDRCPILYKNPLGVFDWVTNYLREIGEARKIDPKLDRDLWDMEKIIWGDGHKGPPTDRRKDLWRKLMVEAVLVTQERFFVKSEYAGNYKCIDNSQGEPVLKPAPKKDVNKSKMVGWIAELEAKRTHSGPEVRTIWGSLKRLDKRYSKMARALENAGFNVESWIAEKLRELAQVEQDSPGNLWIRDRITEYERQIQALRKVGG